MSADPHFECSGCSMILQIVNKGDAWLEPPDDLMCPGCNCMMTYEPTPLETSDDLSSSTVPPGG